MVLIPINFDIMSCCLFTIEHKENCPPHDKSMTVASSDFQQHFPAIYKEVPWHQIKTHMRQAQGKFVEQFICCDIICCFVDDKDLTPEEKAVKLSLKDAIAYYTMYHAFPLLNTQISNMGIQEGSSSEGTSQPSSLWRYKNTRGYISTFADDCLDKVLNLLYKLPDDSKIKAKHLKSDCFNKYHNCFFPELCVFEDCIDIKGSWRTFQAIVPHIKTAVKLCLNPVLCPEFIKYLCDKSKTKDGLNEDEKYLMSLIRPVLANYAMYIGVPHLRIQIEDNGIKMLSSNDGINMKKEAHDQSIHDLKCSYKEKADQCKNDLIIYLYDNADKFPEWKNTSCYSDQESDCPCIIGQECGGVLL